MLEPASYTKQPDEQLTLEIDLSERINNIPIAGYTFSAVSVTMYDDDGTDVTSTMLEGSPSVSGSSILFTVKAGTDGNTYYIKTLSSLTSLWADTQKIEEDLELIVSEEGY